MTRSEIARILGRLGGLKRARRLSRTRRSEIALLGSQARAESLRLERAIRSNFDYVAAIRLLHPPHKVSSESTPTRKLPGIYGPTKTRE